MDIGFFNSITAPGFWIKIITLIAIAFYVVFTFVVFTQIKVMTEILTLPHASPILKLLSIINIIVAVSLFAIAIVIL